jgi:hypothetical protein
LRLRENAGDGKNNSATNVCVSLINMDFMTPTLAKAHRYNRSN